MMTLFMIWILHTMALAVPGPNTLIVSFFAASDKSSTAAYASLGIATGAAIWSSSAILGINSIFELLPQVRLIIQIIGGLYLIYIATRLWGSSNNSLHNDKLYSTPYRAYQKGLLVNLTNPKAALFFGSIFSATLPYNPSIYFLVSAVLLLVVNSLCWHLLLAYFFSTKNMQNIYLKLKNKINKSTSSIFGALGVFVIVKTIRQANN